MKNVFLFLMIVGIYACSNVSEPLFSNEANSIVKTADPSQTSDPNNPLLIDLKSSLELASYIAGRTILKDAEARDQILRLSNQNNGVIKLSYLFNEAIDTSFAEAFRTQFERLWSRPGGEDDRIRPIGYNIVLENIGINKSFNASHYEEYLIFLKELNCLEFYFPIALNVVENDKRITVVIHPLFFDRNENVGAELYKNHEGYNEGDYVLVDMDYVEYVGRSNNNLLVLRPFRSSINGNCDYPYEDFPVNDFINFLNIN